MSDNSDTPNDSSRGPTVVVGSTVVAPQTDNNLDDLWYYEHMDGTGGTRVTLVEILDIGCS